MKKQCKGYQAGLEKLSHKQRAEYSMKPIINSINTSGKKRGAKK